MKRNSEFLELKKNGRRHWCSHWLLLNFKADSQSPLRFGVTASRKVGPAVVRNKLKRWCREYFRDLSKTDRAFGATINVIFKPIDQGFYRGLTYQEFVILLDRGIESIRKNS